jgi:hypothetical protein
MNVAPCCRFRDSPPGGAVGGLLLTLFPFALVAVGLASTEGSDLSPWQVISAISGPFILLSAVLSLWFADASQNGAGATIAQRPCGSGRGGACRRRGAVS